MNCLIAKVPTNKDVVNIMQRTNDNGYLHALTLEELKESFEIIALNYKTNKKS